ncbi:MAG: hypothetical protein IMZ61_03080 [Planctomycetes bacterium]|nr:hypothetical protein [Candidatus Atribacteria bacterium]MBE3142891.1 hypothetical protein [Planctomycetota bacterium]
MPKEFYTERDIEDMFKRGVMSLNVTDNVVLTELAYEKAKRLGMQLVRSQPDNPPSAPVRPYIAQKIAPAALTALNSISTDTERDLQTRIRQAVVARMGNQVDSELLDVIIQRVLKSTGVK